MAALPPAAAPDHGQPAAARARGAGRDPPRPLGGSPHPRPDRRTTCGSARASATARTASGSSTSTGGSGPGGCPRSPAPPGCEPTASCGRWACARGRARGRGARRRTSARSSTPLRRASTRGRRRPLPVEFQLLRLEFEPFDAGRHAPSAKLLSFGLSTNWERELLRAEMARELGAELAARLDPAYPRGNPVVLTPGEAWDGDGLSLAEQIARGPGHDRAGGRGHRLQQLGGRRRALGDRRRRSSPATRTCRPACPGSSTRSGSTSAIASAAARRSRACPGVIMGQNNDVAWAFTNAMADVMDLFVERIDGDTLRVRGRAAAARGSRRRSPSGAAPSPSGSSSRDPPRADRQRGARRRRRRAARAALRGARLPGHHRGEPRRRSSRERPRAGRGARRARTPGLEPGLGRPPRLDRLQDGGPDPDAARRLPGPARSPAGPASTSGRAGSRTRSCRS